VDTRSAERSDASLKSTASPLCLDHAVVPLHDSGVDRWSMRN